MSALLRHLRYAARALARTPGFTVAVVLTLAFGIGANAAVFSAIDAVLLRPLAFPDGDRLVRVRQVHEADANIAPPRLEDWQRMSSTFEAITGYYIEDVSDTTGELPERIRRAVVAPRFLDTWNVPPLLGRGFRQDGQGNAADAVLVSERYWRERLHADPGVLERSIRIEDRRYPIAGVMPAAFRFPDRAVDVWWALPANSPAMQDTVQSRQLRWYIGIGRLKAGVTPAQADADLKLVQQRLAEAHPETDRDVGVRIEPLKDSLVGGARGSLWLLFGAVSVLLLIACTNIAALLLARAARREQEIAIRFSLGASRRAVAAQMLAEAGVLAVAGAALGLLVAAGITAALRAFAPGLPRLDEAGLDGRILLYTALSTIVVALLCGLFPAVRSARGTAALVRAGRSQVSPRHALQWLLVAVQVTLSVTLLIGAGLLLRSFEALSRVDAGFDAENVLAFRVSGSWAESDDRERLVRRIDGTLEALRALPGVQAAATAWALPGLPTRYEIEFIADGRTDVDTPLNAEWRTVSPGYFGALQIPLAAGELCRQREQAGAPQVMVNRRFAERYFAGRSALGRQLTWEGGAESGRIVGVVGDVRERGLDNAPAPTVYACDSAPSPFPWVLLRSAGDLSAMAATVRTKLADIEPLRSVYEIAPLTERIGGAYAQNRLRTVVLTLFAVTALALACLGIYGTLNYIAGLRRREVGLRMALGAAQGSIVAQFMLKALKVVGLACAVGLALSFAFTRLLSGMLYGVSPSDPATLAAVVALVVAVAAAAALLPALRAARVDPMRALRED